MNTRLLRLPLPPARESIPSTWIPVFGDLCITPAYLVQETDLSVIPVKLAPCSDTGSGIQRRFFQAWAALWAEASDSCFRRNDGWSASSNVQRRATQGFAFAGMTGHTLLAETYPGLFKGLRRQESIAAKYSREVA